MTLDCYVCVCPGEVPYLCPDVTLDWLPLAYYLCHVVTWSFVSLGRSMNDSQPNENHRTNDGQGNYILVFHLANGTS